MTGSLTHHRPAQRQRDEATTGIGLAYSESAFAFNAPNSSSVSAPLACNAARRSIFEITSSEGNSEVGTAWTAGSATAGLAVCCAACRREERLFTALAVPAITAVCAAVWTKLRRLRPKAMLFSIHQTQKVLLGLILLRDEGTNLRTQLERLGTLCGYLCSKPA